MDRSITFKGILFISFLASSLFSFAQEEKKDYIGVLKNTGRYSKAIPSDFPVFTYQNANADQLGELRRIFHIDSVAGSGDEWGKAIRLLRWFHNTVPHEDEYNLATLNAKNIINTYREKGIAQACYPLAISMNEIFLSMGFKSRTVICYSGDYERPNGGHVINAVYIGKFQKWVWMDPQFNAYLMDQEDIPLSIDQVRARVIGGQFIRISGEANYHQEKITKEYYIEDFMAEHLYRFICPLNSQYDSETRRPGKTMRYVELLPLNSGKLPVDQFETGQGKGYSVINYHTSNNMLFWKAPEKDLKPVYGIKKKQR
jgi:hypothetical protein